MSKHQIQPEYGDEQADPGRDCRTRLARPNSHTRTTRIFPVQLTTCRINNLTRLIHTLATGKCETLHRYMQTPILSTCPSNLGVCVCVCVFSPHSFWTSSSLDVPAGVTQEEGHTGFLISVQSHKTGIFHLKKKKNHAQQMEND